MITVVYDAQVDNGLYVIAAVVGCLLLWVLALECISLRGRIQKQERFR